MVVFVWQGMSPRSMQRIADVDTQVSYNNTADSAVTTEELLDQAYLGNVCRM